MDRKLKEGDVIKSNKLPSNDKYIVIKTCKEGGGIAQGGDRYSDGHSVYIRLINEYTNEIQFYQSGSFCNSIYPEDIKLLAQNVLFKIEINDNNKT